MTAKNSLSFLSKLIQLSRLLPLVGVILLMMPLLWSDTQAVRTSATMTYVFLVWLLLILTAWLSVRISSDSDPTD